VRYFIPAEGLEQVKGAPGFCGVPLNASKWLAESIATLTPGLKITIPYNPLLFNKIVYNQSTIIDLIDRAERYQNTLRGNNRVNTQAALARKLGISKARLTQIMNLLKLAPEIKSYIKKLDDQELLHFFNEKRLRPIASIQDEKIQIIEFKKIKKAGLGVFRSKIARN
jgi:Trp operon repressor